MAHHKLPSEITIDSLILPIPDSNLQKFLDNGIELLNYYPDILARIESDLDAKSIKNKNLRIEQKRFLEQKTPDLTNMEIENTENPRPAITLQTGRPRLSSKLAYTFFLLRGYFGSLKSAVAQTAIRESITIRALLDEQQVIMPGASTMVENVNAISNDTVSFIHQCQVQRVFDAQLDDFKTCFIDSTSIEANSAWPTDSDMLRRLFQRVYGTLDDLTQYGFEAIKPGWLVSWLGKTNALNFQIQSLSGKANAKSKRKSLYDDLLDVVDKATAHMEKEWNRIQQTVNLNAIAPLTRRRIEPMMQRIDQDLNNLHWVMEYTKERIFEDKNRPSTEKVLSLSDPDAAMIVKGGRETVLGYKPQLARSGNGFITSVLVEEGNWSDAEALRHCVADVISRTHVTPSTISVDDCYSSARNYNSLKESGIDLSMKGAKGKKITPAKDWESDTYKEARRCRSAVESLMFTIKFVFRFGRLGRTGLENVRAELYEKVIAYNFYRMTLVVEARQRAERKKLLKAA